MSVCGVNTLVNAFIPFHVCERSWHIYFILFFKFYFEKKLDLNASCRNSIAVFISPSPRFPKCYNFTIFALALPSVFFLNYLRVADIYFYFP